MSNEIIKQIKKQLLNKDDDWANDYVNFQNFKWFEMDIQPQNIDKVSFHFENQSLYYQWTILSFLTIY